MVAALLVVTGLGALAAGALVLADRFTLAGVCTAVAGGASVLAGMRARDSGMPRMVFADHAVERVMEALVFGAIAWDVAPTSAWTAGAALAALVASYLASYLPAKATGLGFRVHERLPFRSVRLALVAVGLLLPDLLGAALVAAGLVSLEPVIRHGLTVARQREAG
jgi:hypothetical protein